MSFLLEKGNFHCYVRLPECNHPKKGHQQNCQEDDNLSLQNSKLPYVAGHLAAHVVALEWQPGGSGRIVPVWFSNDSPVKYS